MNLALTVPDIDTYIAGKSEFIAGVLLQAGIAKQDVQAIIDQNKMK